MLRFVQLTDTHIGASDDFVMQGVKTSERVAAAIDAIRALPFRPDFVVHTGDIVGQRDERAYERASGLFQRLDVPVYFCAGNWDDRALMEKHLASGPRRLLADPRELLTYTFETKGQHFLVLDADSPKDIFPHGRMSGEQLAIAQRELQNGSIVFFHYPLFNQDCEWIDREMLLLEPLPLQKLLASRRTKAVFLGHLHRPIQTCRDGVLYSVAPSAAFQFLALPSSAKADVSRSEPAGYQVISIDQGAISVKVYSVGHWS